MGWNEWHPKLRVYLLMPVFPQIDTPTESRARRLNVLEAQMQMQEAQAKAAEEQRKRQFFQQFGPGIAAGDPQAISELARIDPTAAQTALQNAGAIRKSEFENQKSEIDFVTQRLTALNYAPEKLRPMMYQSLLAEMSRNGADVSSFPQQYDPQTLQVLERGLMSMSERIQMDYQYNPEAIAERNYASGYSSEAGRRQAALDNPTPTSTAANNPTATDLVNFQLPDGNVVTVDVNNRQGIQDILGQGGVRVSTGQAKTVPSPGGASGVLPEDAGAFLWPDETVPPTAAAGTWPAIGNAINTIVDSVTPGGFLPFPKINEAKEGLRQLEVNTMTLLQDTVPGRPSQYLLQMIQRLTATPVSPGLGVQGMMERLRATRSLIASGLRIEQQSNPQTPTQVSNRDRTVQVLQELLGAYDRAIRASEAGGVEDEPGFGVIRRPGDG